MPSTLGYDEFFRTLAGQSQGPLPYQQRLAEAVDWPARIEVPTGLGKTLAVVCAWLWRRCPGNQHRAATPRRLVYCLPTRVLVEQVRDVVREILARHGKDVSAAILMGGSDDGDDLPERWDTAPDLDLILIGTQDMLLSRALNRGYGMSRYRWPIHFALLNNDALWVIDEVQLVGAGVATTTQLQALRRKLGTQLAVKTCWMSATLEESWLRSVDVDDQDLAPCLRLEKSDLDHPVIIRRRNASKALEMAPVAAGDARKIAAFVLERHRAGTRTLVVLNTVERAQDVFRELTRRKTEAEVTLLHSRFRPRERRANLERALAGPAGAGSILVSTQAVEAGVDLSSTTLVTELAPWASLVQRFGRCNRRGDDSSASVFWLDLLADGKTQKSLSPPYDTKDLASAREILKTCRSASVAELPEVALDLAGGTVLRRSDLLDLFDTSPDLTGHDVDVSRFIREDDDLDVSVFWRGVEEPSADEPSPTSDELCSVPLRDAREWLKKHRLWARDPLDGVWASVDRVTPGRLLLARSRDGGYDARLGWTAKETARVEPVPPVADADEVDDRDNDGEPLSEMGEWLTLARHSEDVYVEVRSLAERLGLPPALFEALGIAGRWHDSGKGHRVWQDAARKLGEDAPSEPVAKCKARGRRLRFARKGFRHELASALLALESGLPDLIVYLIACHHGKVRLSIRSLPTEAGPDDGAGSRRFARGVWDGDLIESLDLGGGVRVPATTIRLNAMELGEDVETGPSWMARMLGLRDDPAIGPFRLSFLEAVIRAADERASRRADGSVP